MNTHSSKNAFSKASSIGIYFTNTLIFSVTFHLLQSYHVLVWHHCHHVFTSCSARQSRLLPFFASWMYLLDGDDKCMLSVPFNTSDLHISCWQSSEIFQAMAADAFMFPNADDLLFALSCFLANVLPALRFPSSRPDTASFRSCLLLPRETNICAGSRALSFFFSSSIGSACHGTCPVYEKLFLGSRTFHVSAPYSTIYSEYAWARSGLILILESSKKD